MAAGFEIKLIDASAEQALRVFFEQIKQSGDDKYFHPHPFDETQAHIRASYRGKDLYYIAQSGSRLIIGYGMLRGWDAGYDVPSLGIIIHPNQRGRGLGSTLMHFLHYAARDRGAKQIRLKVYPDNALAYLLYQKLGYVFQDQLIEGQLLGIKRLL